MIEEEKRLQSLRTNLNETKISLAKLEQQLETAQSSLAELFSRLNTEYGVRSSEEAKEVLQTLQKEYDSLITDAEDKLNEAKSVR